MKFVCVSTNPDYVRILAEVLKACPYEETVTFEQMSDALGFDVKRRRYLIQAARKLASNESGAAFVSAHRIGYTRLLGDEVSVVGALTRQKQRRLGNNAIRIMTNTLATSNDLSHANRFRIEREVAVQGLVRHITKSVNVHPVRADAALPTPASTIRAFIDSQKRVKQAA